MEMILSWGAGMLPSKMEPQAREKKERHEVYMHMQGKVSAHIGAVRD